MNDLSNDGMLDRVYAKLCLWSEYKKKLCLCNFVYTQSKIPSFEWSFKLHISNLNLNCALLLSCENSHSQPMNFLAHAHTATGGRKNLFHFLPLFASSRHQLQNYFSQGEWISHLSLVLPWGERRLKTGLRGKGLGLMTNGGLGRHSSPEGNMGVYFGGAGHGRSNFQRPACKLL